MFFFAKTLLVAGAIATAPLVSPTEVAPDRIPEPHQSAARPMLQHIVRQLVRDGAPGALAVVRTPSGIRRAHAGLASRQPRVPMAATDRFRVASITKTFVATVVLELVAEGTLRLDDPVERWLPGLVAKGRAITIRELLGHTSGLFDYLEDNAFVRAVVAHPGRSWSPRKLVAIATSHPPLFLPGDGWSYSNTNYILLGLVVEAAGGTTLTQQLRRRLFEPLGLTATSFPTGTHIDGAHAHGYIGPATLPRRRSLLDTSPASASLAWAAAAIVSTGDDVTSFYAALLGGRLLPPDLLAEMETPTVDAHYGLGLLEADTPCGRAYGHEGNLLGYRSFVFARPDGARVALVMVNVDRTYLSRNELEAAAETALCSG
jgi:D-alanyl-D-alanine carboxypeptidase